MYMATTRPITYRWNMFFHRFWISFQTIRICHISKNLKNYILINPNWFIVDWLQFICIDKRMSFHWFYFSNVFLYKVCVDRCFNLLSFCYYRIRKKCYTCVLWFNFSFRLIYFRLKKVYLHVRAIVAYKKRKMWHPRKISGSNLIVLISTLCFFYESSKFFLNRKFLKRKKFVFK